MKKRISALLLALMLLLGVQAAEAGDNYVLVQTAGQGIAVYTESRGGKQAGILYNGGLHDLTLEPENGLYRCRLTDTYAVWLNQDKAISLLPDEYWVDSSLDAGLDSGVFLAEVKYDGALLREKPGKGDGIAQAAGTRALIVGEFGSDYYYAKPENGVSTWFAGFYRREDVTKVRALSYPEAEAGLPVLEERVVYGEGRNVPLSFSALGYAGKDNLQARDGKKVSVAAWIGDWAQLQDGGFIERRFLEEQGDHAIRGEKATVKTSGVLNRLNVRNSAESDSWAVAKLCAGTEVEVLYRAGDWAAIHLEGSGSGAAIDGFVQTAYLAFEEDREKVKPGTVRIRVGRDALGCEKENYREKKDSAHVFRDFPAGTELTVVGVRPDYDSQYDLWNLDSFLVRTEEGELWWLMNRETYGIEVTQPLNKSAKTAQRVKLLSFANKESESLLTLKAGVKVEVLLRGEGWTMVRYKEQTGYVMSRYLKFP